ncbi:protein kinase [Hortaea werneckii]|nr:protein kinase [Hortaea werneckii]
MNDAIPVAIIECTCNLAPEFAGLLLFQPAVTDDVVQHLSTVDILKEHVPVVVGSYDIAHTTDVRMVDKRHNGCLACGSDLFAVICPLALGLCTVLALATLSRNDLYRYLLAGLLVPGKLHLAHTSRTDSLAEIPVTSLSINGRTPSEVGAACCPARFALMGAMTAIGGRWLVVVARSCPRVCCGLSHGFGAPPDVCRVSRADAGGSGGGRLVRGSDEAAAADMAGMSSRDDLYLTFSPGKSKFGCLPSWLASHLPLPDLGTLLPFLILILILILLLLAFAPATRSASVTRTRYFKLGSRPAVTFAVQCT